MNIKIFLAGYFLVSTNIVLATDNQSFNINNRVVTNVRYQPTISNAPLQRREAGFVDNKSGNVNRANRGISRGNAIK